MAHDDPQIGALIAKAFAKSQGYDHEGGLPENRSTMSFGAGVLDMTQENPKFPGVPPQEGPIPPSDDGYRQFRTSQT